MIALRVVELSLVHQPVVVGVADAGARLLGAAQQGIHLFTTVQRPREGDGGRCAGPPDEVFRAAEELGITIDELKLSAEGDLDVRGFFGLDETVRPGFTAVRVTVDITGPDSAERYRELTDTVDAHCPVLDLTQNPTPVTTTLRVN